MLKKDSDLSFIKISDIDPSIIIEMPYATDQNFCGSSLYPKKAQAYLRKPVAHALSQANQAFKSQGLCLKVWDAYRPFSIQKQLWAVCPDERYVAKPLEKDGQIISGSKHNAGAAVDATLVKMGSGEEILMPTCFDDFSERAHRACQNLPEQALANRNLLEAVMVEHGFIGLPTEWWHFDWEGHEHCQIEEFPMVEG